MFYSIELLKILCTLAIRLKCHLKNLSKKSCRTILECLYCLERESHCYSNPLCRNEYFLLYVLIQKLGMVHCIYRGVTVYNFRIYLFLKMNLVSTNSEYPGEMPHHAAFHLGLHCFPKHLFKSQQYTKKNTVYRINET